MKKEEKSNDLERGVLKYWKFQGKEGEEGGGVDILWNGHLRGCGVQNKIKLSLA